MFLAIHLNKFLTTFLVISQNFTYISVIFINHLQKILTTAF